MSSVVSHLFLCVPDIRPAGLTRGFADRPLAVGAHVQHQFRTAGSRFQHNAPDPIFRLDSYSELLDGAERNRPSLRVPKTHPYPLTSTYALSSPSSKAAPTGDEAVKKA